MQSDTNLNASTGSWQPAFGAHGQGDTTDAETPAPRNSLLGAREMPIQPWLGSGAGDNVSTLVRRRVVLPGQVGADADVEAALATPQARLQNLAPGANAQHRELALNAAHALYGADLGAVPDDLLRNLVRQAPTFIRHGVTSQAELAQFFQRSWGEVLTPILGRLGYAPALLLMGDLAGAHIPAPFTGMPIGFAVMFSAMVTNAMADGLKDRRYPDLVTSGLPPSLQQRVDSYGRDTLPPGVVSELSRQSLRAMMTIVPALNALRTGEPLDLQTIVRNDVAADALSYPIADNIVPFSRAVLKALQHCCMPQRASRAPALTAPQHEELVAHQPTAQLDRRLRAFKQGAAESAGDGLGAVKDGVINLATQQQGRLGVPVNAGMLIAMALGMTAYLIDKDPENARLPAGKITPRSALAVPATLMYMEILATLAFPAVLKTCDAISRKKPFDRALPDDPLEGFWDDTGSERELTDFPATSSPTSQVMGRPVGGLHPVTPGDRTLTPPLRHTGSPNGEPTGEPSTPATT